MSILFPTALRESVGFFHSVLPKILLAQEKIDKKAQQLAAGRHGL